MNGAGWEKKNRAAISRPKDILCCEDAVHRKIDTSTDALTVTGNPTTYVKKHETPNPKA